MAAESGVGTEAFCGVSDVFRGVSSFTTESAPVRGQLWPSGRFELATPPRVAVTYTTDSLADDAEERGAVTMAKAYRVLKLQADRACRVRVYDTTLHRLNDASRPIGTDPTGDHGLMLEYVFTDAATATLTPTVDGFNDESTPSSSIPIAVQNLSGATDTVAVTFTYIQTET